MRVHALLAVAVIVVASIAVVASNGQTTQPTHDPKALHKEMEAMNRSLQKLTRQIKDKSKNESSLAVVGELQQHTIACKLMMPTGATTQPADQQPKYVAEYRRQMAEVLRTELDLEQQIIDGKNDEAAQTIKKLRDQEKAGHKVYQPKEKED